MEKLSDLPNIGTALEKQLNNVGIFSPAELKSLGSKEAWLRILNRDSSACLHRLSALEGAVQGVRKSQLSDEIKAELKQFYNDIKHPKA